MKIGDWIKDYRLKHDNMSLQAFADLSGFSKAYVAILEKGVNPSTGKPVSPTMTTFEKIARVAGMDVNDFIAMLDKDQTITLGFDVTKIPGYIPMPIENRKIPIVGTVKCGLNGLAFEYIDGYVFIDEYIAGDIMAFRCKGDSMKDVGISDGDIAIVRKQCNVENGELAVVIINGDEGTLKRIRHHDGILVLEAANQEYPPRIFAGEEINIVKIIGKVLEVRKKF